MRAGGTAALGVGWLVPDHPGIGKGETEIVRGLEEKSRGWLAAITHVRIAGRQTSGVMETIPEAHEMDVRSGQGGHEPLMNFPECVVARLAQREVGLVGNENEGIACIPQLQQSGNHTLDQAKFRCGERRLHAACARVQDRRVQNAVAVEKNGGPVHRADSHFISLARRRGWETRRCQTTAWNSSVWGVTVSGERVGMIRQASAT